MPSPATNRSRKALLVTGAHGFVAGSVLSQAGDDWELHAISRGAALAGHGNVQWHSFDPLAGDALATLFHQVRPQAVIHTAAMADIDICQAQPELARAANVTFTRALARLCADSGARLVFCSTDTVFDGEHAPYSEDAPPGPLNTYAETKVEAEKLVSRLGALGVIARLSLVVGLPVLGAGNSFLARTIASLKQGRAVAFPGHEVRTPVDVVTVGRALLELAAGNQQGIFHLAGHDCLSRFAMAQAIARRLGFPEHLITNQGPATTPGRAPRPRDVSLTNARACAQLQTPMRSLDQGLSLILENADVKTL